MDIWGETIVILVDLRYSLLNYQLFKESLFIAGSSFILYIDGEKANSPEKIEHIVVKIWYIVIPSKHKG